MGHFIELAFEQPVEGKLSYDKAGSCVGRAGIRPLQGIREYAVCEEALSRNADHRA